MPRILALAWARLVIEDSAIDMNLKLTITGVIMRKLLKPFAVLAILGSYSNAVQADQGQFYIAPGIQWMNFDDGLHWTNDDGYFFGFGYDFTDRLSGEISTWDLDPNVNGGGDIDLDHYKADLFYDLNQSIGAFSTFIVSGFGNLNTQGRNDTLWDIGAGIEYEINDNLSWRTALRNYTYFGRDHEDNDYGVDTALVYRFGGKKSSPAPRREEPAAAAAAPEAPRAAAPDADRDGVPDSRDNCPDTPRNYAVDANGCPIAVEEVARVELLVNFDFDKSDVKPQYYPEIQEVADFMKQYPDTIIELEGHTDSRGDDEYNRALSQRRADAVEAVLVERFAIQASRITAQGFGESQPVASNSTDAGRAANRRVMTVIIKTLQNYRPR